MGEWIQRDIKEAKIKPTKYKNGQSEWEMGFMVIKRWFGTNKIKKEGMNFIIPPMDVEALGTYDDIDSVIQNMTDSNKIYIMCTRHTHA